MHLGAAKVDDCGPAEVLNDYAVGQRHQLPIIGVLNLDATINSNAPDKYQGLDRFAARKAVVADLDAAVRLPLDVPPFPK